MFQVEEENSQNEETKQKPSLVFGFRNTLDCGKKDLYDFYTEEYPGDTYCTRLLLCTDLTLGFDTQSPCPFTNDMTIPV